MSDKAYLDFLTGMVKVHKFPESIKEYKLHDVALAFQYLAYHPIIKGVQKEKSRKLMTKNLKDVIDYRFRDSDVKKEITGIYDMNNTIYHIIKYNGDGKFRSENKDNSEHKKFLIKSLGLLEKKLEETPEDKKEPILKIIDTKKKLLEIMDNKKTESTDNDILIQIKHINGVGKRIFDIYRGSRRDDFEIKKKKINNLNDCFKNIINMSKGKKGIGGFTGPDNSGEIHKLKNKERERTFNFDKKFMNQHKDHSSNQSKKTYRNPYVSSNPNNKTHNSQQNNTNSIGKKDTKSKYVPPNMKNKNNNSSNKYQSNRYQSDKYQSNRYQSDRYQSNRYQSNRYESKYKPKNENHVENSGNGFVSIHKLRGIDQMDLPVLGGKKKTEKKKIVSMDSNNPFDILETWDDEDDTKWTDETNKIIEEENEKPLITTKFYNEFKKGNEFIIIYDYSYNYDDKRFEDPQIKVKLALRESLNNDSLNNNPLPKFFCQNIKNVQLTRNKFYRKYILPRKQSNLKEEICIVDDIDNLCEEDKVWYCKYLKLSVQDMADIGIHNEGTDEESELSYYDEYGNLIDNPESDDEISEESEFDSLKDYHDEEDVDCEM